MQVTCAGTTGCWGSLPWLLHPQLGATLLLPSGPRFPSSQSPQYWPVPLPRATRCGAGSVLSPSLLLGQGGLVLSAPSLPDAGLPAQIWRLLVGVPGEAAYLHVPATSTAVR